MRADRGIDEWRDNPDEDDEASRLGGDREERGDRCGGTLVDVRHPDLERRGSDFESEPDHQQREGEDGCGFRHLRGGERDADLGEIGLAGDTEGPGDAVD